MTDSVEIAHINRVTHVHSSYLKLVIIQDFLIFHFLGLLSGNTVICRDTNMLTMKTTCQTYINIYLTSH